MPARISESPTSDTELPLENATCPKKGAPGGPWDPKGRPGRTWGPFRHKAVPGNAKTWKS